MLAISWTPKAARSLNNIFDFLAAEDPTLAQTIVSHIVAQIEILRTFPNLGRAGRVMGTRELVITQYPFLVPYRVRENTVEVLHVFHTRQHSARLPFPL